MIINSQFKAAWWLPGPHLQTLWPALMRRPIHIPIRRERLELPDGDFVDLDWAISDNTGPLVLILHGLEGSIESPYAKGLMQALLAHGYPVVFMHFRGCSGEHNRLARAYHSGDTGDLAYVVEHLQQTHGQRPIHAVGYSLGGNVLLKWLGETGTANPLQSAVAVSVPFSLEQSANKMNTGFSKVYQWHLLKQLRNKIIDKTKDIPSPITYQQLKPIKNFWDFDNTFTAPIHGFPDAECYYQHASSRQYLQAIQKPTLIIHAKDDPFMTHEAIPELGELSQTVTLELATRGGHVGFVSGNQPGRSQYWLEQRIPQFLNSCTNC